MFLIGRNSDGVILYTNHKWGEVLDRKKEQSGKFLYMKGATLNFTMCARAVEDFHRRTGKAKEKNVIQKICRGMIISQTLKQKGVILSLT